MCGMATRLREPAVRRPSLPLTQSDLHALDSLRQAPDLLESLNEIAGTDIDLRSATESALLQAIFRAGLQSVTETALDRGYRELAMQNRGEGDEPRARARRRRPAWADEP